MSRGRLWLANTVLGAALVSGSCKEDVEEADAQASDRARTADAREPAVASTEASVEVDPQPEPGVVLLEPGRAPQEVLSWHPEPGIRRTLVVSMRVNTRTGTEPAPLSPRVRLVVDAALETVAPDGKIRRAFEIEALEVEPDERVDAEAAQAMRDTLNGLAGNKGVVESDPLGSATDLAVAGAIAADSRVSKFVAAMRHAWSHLAIPLPAEPVGRGARWTATRRIDLHGIAAWQIATYTLEKREGDQIEVEGEVTYRLADPGSQPVGFDPVEQLDSLAATGTVDARLDLATASPIEAHVGLSATFEALGRQGTPVPGKVGIDVTVDEDWLAREDPRVKLLGRFAQGGLVRGTVDPGTRVWLDRRPVEVSEEGDFLVGFGRDDDRKALLSFAFPDGPVERHVVHIEPRQYEPERIDGLPEEMVHPSREARRIMAKARRVIKKLRTRTTPTPYFRGGFRMPLRGKITSTYGRKRILNGEDRGYHWGLDIAAPVGKRVKAPAAGKVVYAQADLPLSGTMLVIDHGHGLTSSFLHLKDIKVSVGDEVEAGQLVATVGNTGRTTGPHLDWRMNLFDARIDPQLVLAW